MNQSNEKVAIVIPARMGSSRFPGKPLADVAGLSLIERVWRIAKAVSNADAVLIATDSAEIEACAQEFDAQVVMTSENCRTGTDRVAEAIKNCGDDAEIVFSLQGDAVLTPPWILEEVIDAMRSDSQIQIATPAVKLQEGAREAFIAEKIAGSSTGTRLSLILNTMRSIFPNTLFQRRVNQVMKQIYLDISVSMGIAARP